MYSYSYIDATDEPHIINIIRKRADVFFFLRSDEVLTELSAVDGQVERERGYMDDERSHLLIIDETSTQIIFLQG